MSNVANQSELIITLSQDKVRLSLAGNSENGLQHLDAAYPINGLFREDKISQTLDLALSENPPLVDQFLYVEVIMLDRPNVFMPSYYLHNDKAGDIASRYLRIRSGEMISSDTSANSVFCYTLPSDTINVLKEYYSNIICAHITSVLWNTLSQQPSTLDKNQVLLYHILYDRLLITMGVKNGKLIFSKTFPFTNEPDLTYFTIAVSRMLKPKEQCLVTFDDQRSDYEMPGEKLLKINQRLAFPSLQSLMTSFRPCGS